MSLYKVHKIIINDNCYFVDVKYKSEDEWNLDVTCSRDSLYVPLDSLYAPLDSDIAAGEFIMQERPGITLGTARWKVCKFWFDKIMSAPENWF